MRDFPTIKLADLQADHPGVFDTAHYVDVGVGWIGLIHDFVAEALPHDACLTVYEIKEKWGGLRIWCDSQVLETRLAKAKAEIKSCSVCEVCGAPGFLRRPLPGLYAWWRTLCDNDASEDQRSWATRTHGPMYGRIQVGDDWYQYDVSTDAMIPSEPPSRRI